MGAVDLEQRADFRTIGRGALVLAVGRIEQDDGMAAGHRHDASDALDAFDRGPLCSCRRRSLSRLHGVFLAFQWRLWELLGWIWVGSLMGRNTVTRVPLPFWESTVRLPPCSLASAAEMGRPSPVPSWRLLKPASTWPKGRTAVSMSATVMPPPLSEMVRLTKPSLDGFARNPTRPLAGVNLTALPRRLIRICLILSGSA